MLSLSLVQFVAVTIWTLAIWTVYSMRYLAVVEEYYAFFVAIGMATIGTLIFAAGKSEFIQVLIMSC